ncbi:MAG: carboxypeptidase-like regulatory domain-containing protein [Polyangiales bacterium]
MKRTRVVHLACSITSVGLISGCNSLLGVEPLKGDPAPEAGGTGTAESPSRGAAGGGGRLASTGGERAAAGSGEPGNAGTRASAGAGGEPGDDEPKAGAGGSGGSVGAAGTAAAEGGTGGNAGTAGAAAPSGGPVEGRVIDNRNHPVPNATVRIGEQRTLTDDAGRFRFESAPATYSVTASIIANVRGGASRVAWEIAGLTRRDPTVQVYRALPTQSANVELRMNNATSPLPSNQTFVLGWASPDGETSYNGDYQALAPEIEWIGPTTSVGIAYALHLEYDASGELPAKYLAYASQPLTLEVGQETKIVELDLTPQSIASSTISGTISGLLQNRIVRVYWRKEANTALELVSDAGDLTAFSYLVPSLGGDELTVAVEDQANGRSQGMSAAFIDGVVPGQSDIALVLPPFPVLRSPANAKTDVDAGTVFEWQTDAKVSLFCAHAVDNYDMACVLTGDKTATLPVAPKSDLVTPAAAMYTWTVETHGDFASVDDACTDKGTLSPYATGAILGTKRGSGSYTASAANVFTTKP